jgi:chromosome segregation ATPase
MNTNDQKAEMAQLRKEVNQLKKELKKTQSKLELAERKNKKYQVELKKNDAPTIA